MTPVNHFGSTDMLKFDRGSSSLLPLSMAKVQLRGWWIGYPKKGLSFVNNRTQVATK